VKFYFAGIQILDILAFVQRSLGLVAIQPRNGTITIPAEARRALCLDTRGAQVEVILRDNDIMLVPHLAISLEQVREDDAALGRDRHPASR